jgi:hypothetical protein
LQGKPASTICLAVTREVEEWRSFARYDGVSRSMSQAFGGLVSVIARLGVQSGRAT